MEKKINRKEKYKISIMGILCVFCCSLTYYFHTVLEYGNVFTHFFYIPIILASIWWKRKGLVVAIFFAVFLILNHFFIKTSVETIYDLFRAPMFLLVAIVAAFLSEAIEKKQKEIKKEKNFSANVIASVPDSLIVLDKDLRIKKVNLSFQKIFGVEPQNTIGTSVTEILGDEDGKLSSTLTKILGTKTKIENFELFYQSEKLGKRIFNIAARGIIQAEIDGGENEEVLIVIEDITERKQSEEMLRRFNEELELKVTERTAELDKKMKEIERQKIATFNLSKDLEEVNISLREEISERKSAEKEIKASQEQLRNLSSHLQTVREEERTNMAHDIHDVMGSALTALKMDVSLIEKGLTDEQFKEHERINSMKDLISETVKNVQKIAAELRPGILDDFGLTMAIEWQANEFEKRSEVKCKINIDAEEIILDEKLSTAVFRIFQESFTNVARHSKADKVKVDFVLKKDELKLTIVDNGIGIKDGEIKDSKSIGLLGMQERVYPWKGSVDISGIPGEGTSVKVSIPLR